MNPTNILRKAIKLVPAVKYALGVAGVVAAAAIVIGFATDLHIAVVGGLLVFLGMAALLLFAKVASLPATKFRGPGLVLVWSVVLLVVLTGVALFGCIFLRFPLDLGHWLDPALRGDTSERDGGHGRNGSGRTDPTPRPAAIRIPSVPPSARLNCGTTVPTIPAHELEALSTPLDCPRGSLGVPLCQSNRTLTVRLSSSEAIPS